MACGNNATERLEPDGGMILKVSVIVPAYNAAGTICTVAEGLLGQTYRNMEIIVVDDGSKDNTADVLKPYGEALRLIRKENGGVSSARNRGLREASGEYIMFADADDSCPPDMVQTAVEAMENGGGDYLIAGYTKVCGGKRVDYVPKAGAYSQSQIRERLSEALSNGLNCVYAKLYKRSILTEYAIAFDETLPLGEDFNFNLEYLLRAERVVYLDRPIYSYLVENSTATTIYRKDLYAVRRRSLEKMDRTLAAHHLENPMEGLLRTKFFYAMIFNLQKKQCPMTYGEKCAAIKKAKADLPAGTGLGGKYRLLNGMARSLPGGALYGLCAVLRKVIGILPDRVRGVSI